MDAFDSIHSTAARWLRNSALAPFVGAYWRHLTEQQYTPRTTKGYLCCVAHFARWSHRRRVTKLVNFEEDSKRFVDEHLPECVCPRPVQRCRHQVRAALRQMGVVLADAGVAQDIRCLTPIEELLRRFDSHLRLARGLALSTRRRRLAIVGALVRRTAAPTPTADELREFIAQELARLSPASGGSIGIALRSYLRFRAFEGERVDHLLPVIVSPAYWRLAPLPQSLSGSEIEQLLAAFPPGLSSRHRSYAMVRCVVDLGLRSSEVVNLALDDIDWTAGTVRIAKSKSRRIDVLPLPQTTGRAIVEYLQSERPTTANRRIFVRHVAPVDKPVGPNVVRRAVRDAYQRCGLPYTRVHILRHTLASRLLDAGGTLKEVADVLRHRELDTSLIYAKVDMGRLSAVATPWPGSAA